MSSKKAPPKGDPKDTPDGNQEERRQTTDRSTNPSDAETADQANQDRPTSDTSSQSAPPSRPKISKKTLFFVSCTVIAIVLYAVVNAQSLSNVFQRLGDILAPITIGGVIAYLCNPIMRFYEYVIFRKMKKGKLHSTLSLIMTIITVLGILAGFLALIVPELINSITQLTNNYKDYISSLKSFLDGILDKLRGTFPSIPDANALLEKLGLNSAPEILSTIKGILSDMDVGGGVVSTIGNVVTVAKNLVLGIFIAIYLLASKEKRTAQIRKARAALLNDKQDKKLTEIVLLVDKTFGGFIKGLLLDAVAVGVLTFLLLTIFNVSDYNLLIAAICAVTNVIPVFGPFIGAIPSGLIVLITNPSKFLVFVILILVIQQIDGNILVPRIQGSNTGISSLAVLIAITVMGSLFGIVGMIIGVPVFAVIIELVKRELEKRLRKRGLETDTVAYYPSDAVGNAEEEVYYEHAHLRYKYEHSKSKIFVDRTRARFVRKKAPSQKADSPAPEPPEKTVKPDTNPEVSAPIEATARAQKKKTGETKTKTKTKIKGKKSKEKKVQEKPGHKKPATDQNSTETKKK